MSKGSFLLLTATALLAIAVAGCERADAPKSESSPAAATQPQQLWTCSMHPQVVQDHPGECPICGMDLVPVAAPAVPAAPTEPAAATQEKQLWTCSMHPQVIRDHPGDCPICGMDLEPVAAPATTQSHAGGIRIDPVVVQNMGVRTAPVVEGSLSRVIRATAALREAQPRVHEVNLRVSGWIETLTAHTQGMHVEKGEPLFELYSPELQVAIEELITARRSSANGAGETQKLLLDAATRKLRLWGLDDAQITELAQLETAPRTVVFRSPIEGDVAEKPIVAGSAVNAGDRVLRIVDRSTLWVDAQVFPADIAYITLGQPVHATIEGRPGEHVQGKIIFIAPAVDPMTRTTTVRVELPNPSLDLRPGMFATVSIDAPIAEKAVLVPREAVIDTGARQVVFLSHGVGHFEPREVSLGASGNDGMIQVLAGLSAGDSVVTSGQFLLDSESRTREALAKYRDQNAASATAPPPQQQGHQH